MKPNLRELKDKDWDNLILFNIVINSEGKTTKFFDSIVSLGTSMNYLKVGANLYQVFYSDGNFYPIFYKVISWNYLNGYKPIDYYLATEINNEVKIKKYYGNLKKYKLLN
jgi:hypothetical protein